MYTQGPPPVYTPLPLVYASQKNLPAYTRVPPFVYTGDVENYLNKKRYLTEMPDDLNTFDLLTSSQTITIVEPHHSPKLCCDESNVYILLNSCPLSVYT